MYARPQASLPAVAAPALPADAALAWTVHAAPSQPGRTLAALLGVSVTWWVGMSAFHSPLVGAAASLAVLGSVVESLFPIRHRVTPDAVTTRCAWQIRTLAWEKVKSVTYGPEGVFISPLVAGSRLGRFRGIALRFADGNRDEVLATVRRYYHAAQGESA